MDPGLLRDALTVLVGVGTGILSAAFGVGGGVVSTPAIRALGVPALLAVGTTLPSIFPSAASGTARYVRENLIVWRVVATTAPAGVAAAVAGAELSDDVPGEGHLLMVITALLLAYTAVSMAKGKKQTEVDAVEQSNGGSTGALVLIGVSAGFLSGLLGIGGGVVMVPGFTQLGKMALKPAIATSLACVALFAIPGTITHALNDNVDWRIALLLTAGVVPGARLGAAAAMRASDANLRKAVAGFLGLVAVVYLIGELVALVD